MKIKWILCFLMLSHLQACESDMTSTTDIVPLENKTEFTLDADALHYILISISDIGERDIPDLKQEIARFNEKYGSTKELRISNLYLGTDTNRPLFVIRRLENRREAMFFVQKMMSESDFFRGVKYIVLSASQNNYRQILKDKSLDGYANFFDENY